MAVVALLLVSLAICAPAIRAGSWSEVVLHVFDSSDDLPLSGMIQGNDHSFYGTTAGGYGTVFQLTPSGTLTTFYQFCQVYDPGTLSCLDGGEPYAGLIKGSDGNFYGTTIAGGANPNQIPDGPGTVFKLTPTGTLTTLYSFCGQANCTDGWNPDAGVIQGRDGNFYGTTYLGGANGSGTVYQLTPSGTLTTLYSFCGKTNCIDGALPYAGVIQGSDGNFYGAASEGGAQLHGNGGTVFKITPSGTLITLHSFCNNLNCSDGQFPFGNLIQGSDGNFYGTTLIGGDNEHGTVFKITPSGTLITLHTFTGADGESPYAGLIKGSDGNFYGTTFGGGAKQGGTAYKITPSGTLTTLYSFCTQPVCSDGESPYGGLVQGSDGNFYGTTDSGETGYGTVFELIAALPTPTPTATPAPTATPTATPAPGELSVSPLELTLKTTGEVPVSKPVLVKNKGNGMLSVTVTGPTHNPPFSVDVSQLIVAPNSTSTVTVTFSPIKKGIKTNTIKIKSASPRKSFEVFLTGKSK